MEEKEEQLPGKGCQGILIPKNLKLNNLLRTFLKHKGK